MKLKQLIIINLLILSFINIFIAKSTFKKGKLKHLFKNVSNNDNKSKELFGKNIILKKIGIILIKKIVVAKHRQAKIQVIDLIL